MAAVPYNMSSNFSSCIPRQRGQCKRRATRLCMEDTDDFSRNRYISLHLNRCISLRDPPLNRRTAVAELIAEDVLSCVFYVALLTLLSLSPLAFNQATAPPQINTTETGRFTSSAFFFLLAHLRIHLKYKYPSRRTHPDTIIFSTPPSMQPNLTPLAPLCIVAPEGARLGQQPSNHTPHRGCGGGITFESFLGDGSGSFARATPAFLCGLLVLCCFHFGDMNSEWDG